MSYDYSYLASLYFPHLQVLGDFSQTKFAKITEEERKKMSPAELKLLERQEQEFFADSRQHGLDRSIFPFGIGGSDVGTILSKGFNSPSWLFERKRNFERYRNEKPSAEQQKLFDTGHFAEPVIRSIFERKTKLKTLEWPLQVVNPKYPHCIANVDGLVFENGKIGIYEGKWSNKPKVISRVWRKMANHLKDYGTFPDISLVPENYLLQVWFYLAVYELEFAYICGGWGFEDTEIGYTKIYRLPVDKEQELMEICENFVEMTALGIKPTDIDFPQKEKLLDFYKKSHASIPKRDGIVAFPSVAAITADSVLSLEEEVKSIEKAINAELSEMKKKLCEKYNYEQKKNSLLSAKAYFCENMYDKSEGFIETADGIYVIQYTEREGRKGFQKDYCKSKYPEIFDEIYHGKKQKELNIIKKEV